MGTPQSAVTREETRLRLVVEDSQSHGLWSFSGTWPPMCFCQAAPQREPRASARSSCGTRAPSLHQLSAGSWGLGSLVAFQGSCKTLWGLVGTLASPTFLIFVNRETTKMETLSPLSFLQRAITCTIHHFYFRRIGTPFPIGPYALLSPSAIGSGIYRCLFQNFIIKEEC